MITNNTLKFKGIVAEILTTKADLLTATTENRKQRLTEYQNAIKVFLSILPRKVATSEIGHFFGNCDKDNRANMVKAVERVALKNGGEIVKIPVVVNYFRKPKNFSKMRFNRRMYASDETGRTLNATDEVELLINGVTPLQVRECVLSGTKSILMYQEKKNGEYKSSLIRYLIQNRD